MPRNGWNANPYKQYFRFYRDQLKPNYNIQTMKVIDKDDLTQQGWQVASIRAHDDIIIEL